MNMQLKLVHCQRFPIRDMATGLGTSRADRLPFFPERALSENLVLQPGTVAVGVHHAS